MRKYLFFIWLACLPLSTRGQTLEDPDFTALLQPVGVQSLQYWFDDGTNSLKETNDIAGYYSFDVPTLEDGLHTLHCLVKGTNGELYGTSSKVFLILKGEELPPHASLEGAKLQYWFDEHGDALQTASGLSGVYKPDVSALADGLHVIHYVVVGADGKVYSTGADTFIKMAEMLNEEVVAAVKAKGIAYWFDDDVAHKKTSTDLSGTYSLDVSALEDGLHVLHYHIVGENNLPYGVTSTMFLKNEAQYAVREPARITKYTYWLNHDGSTAKTVTLDQPVNPYTLMSLLPLQRMPIRSSLFHFQMDDGVPTIYAKNTFNIRFYDSNGYFADNFIENEKTFIDYGVSQQITDAELLISGNKVTINKPTENFIKWYCLTAERGDSLELKLDKPATLQVFSPSGKEVYNASGVESVNIGGCHVEESGTFYVALHDVTAANGNTISMDYNHIDKFALISYTPTEIGVTYNILNMSLNGNGFDKLKSATLKYGHTEVQSKVINLNCKDKGQLQFKLTGEESHGMYDLILNFEDDVEQKTIIKQAALSLVTPEYGKIKTSVSYAPSWSQPLTISVKVRNEGNVPYHIVPINIAYDKPQAVEKLEFGNFYIPMSNDAIEEKYTPFFHTDNFLGENVSAVVSNLFIPELGANEEQTYVLKLTAGAVESLNLYAWTGEPINSEERMTESVAQKGNAKERDKGTNIPSYEAYLDTFIELVDDVQSLIGDIKDLSDFDEQSTPMKCMNIAKFAVDAAQTSVALGKTIGGISNGIGNKLDEMRLSVIDDYEVSEMLKDRIRRRSMPSPSSIFDGTNIPIVGKLLKFWEIQKGYAERNNPNVEKNNIIITRPCDPNEITGYLSIGGSQYIPKGLKTTSYTIECENDPELATAAAHRIVIKDHIDGNTHKLSSFGATGIKIGNKYMPLDGEKQFVKTMDLRPELNVVAEVALTYNENTGDAQWIINSLDPMTMELSTDPAVGALPVNLNGEGTAEVYFSIDLQNGLTDGNEITNEATIIFDEEAPINTPVWKNIIDDILPSSHITNIENNEDHTISVSISASDNRSLPWQYDVYAKLSDSEKWNRVAVGIPVDQKANIGFEIAGTYDFYSVVTDYAGNTEEKEPVVEHSIAVLSKLMKGDVNCDSQITAQDASLVLQHVAGKTPLNDNVKKAADVNGDGDVTAQDASLILQKVAGK